MMDKDAKDVLSKFAFWAGSFSVDEGEHAYAICTECDDGDDDDDGCSDCGEETEDD